MAGGYFFLSDESTHTIAAKPIINAARKAKTGKRECRGDTEK
jgi:hypothetical protein